MDSGFGQWLAFLFKFCYDALYSVKIPGINIPVLYFIILISLVTIIFSILKRMLYQPVSKSKNNAKANSKKSKEG